jgi:ribosomal-protein-alanine N-acetyltransferase
VSPCPDRLRTLRLELVRITPDDRDFLVELWDDPRVAATLGGRKAPEVHDARIARLVGHWAEHGYGAWIAHTTTGPIGYCGLGPTDVGGPDGVELLYAQVPAAWGSGYVTEAARAVLDVAFDRVDGLGLAEVVAFTLPTNRASQAVMERCGFTFAGDVEHAGLPHVLYRLPRGAFSAARGDAG